MWPDLAALLCTSLPIHTLLLVLLRCINGRVLHVAAVKAAVVARRYDAAGALCCVFGPKPGLRVRWDNQRAIGRSRRVHAVVEASSGAGFASALYASGMR